METKENIFDGVTVLELSGRFDSTQTRDFKEKIHSLISISQVYIVLNLKDVAFIDSSALGSIVACLRSLNQANGDIKLANLQDEVRGIFTLTRLSSVFEIFDDVKSAVNSF